MQVKVQSTAKEGLVQQCKTSKASKPDAVSKFVTALKQCARLRDLETGIQLHREAVSARLHTSKYVGSGLITMYSRCRRMALAAEVFDEMLQRDVVTWNSLITGYVENGESLRALQVYSLMDCRPSSVTFVAALKACRGLAGEEGDKQLVLEKVREIHEQARRNGFDTELAVATTLVDVNCRCGEMVRAREVFDRMETRDVVVWTALILGYSENGGCSEALKLFDRMDCQPDCFTYVAALKACGGLANERESEKVNCLKKGEFLCKSIEALGFDSNIVVGSALVDMYGKCGRIERGKEIFDSLSYRDVVAWNSLILGYVGNGECNVAMDLMVCMDCKPSSVTLLAWIKVCGGLKQVEKLFRLEKAIGIHKAAKSLGFESSGLVSTALVDLYSRCGSMLHARRVFNSMSTHNVVSWTSLLLGYVENGEFLLALELFGRMDCEPSSVTYAAALKACAGLVGGSESERMFCLETGVKFHEQLKNRGLEAELTVTTGLLELYRKCRAMERAKEVFDEMKQRNVFTWTTLMQGYVENQEYQAAVELFFGMDCEPDPFTYVVVLKAFGSMASLPAGRLVHAKLCQLGLEQEPVVSNTLADFYVKCGCITTAEELFNGMDSPDIVSWTTVISGWSALGDSSRVFTLARKMQDTGLRVDDITFSCILMACSHAGLVDEARNFFDSVVSRGSVGLSVEHYNCMVDVLGRANRLHEALSLINTMPLEANSVTWRTLLGACRKWKNMEVGKAAFDALASSDVKQRGAERASREFHQVSAWWCDSQGRTVEFVSGNQLDEESTEKLQHCKVFFV